MTDFAATTGLRAAMQGEMQQMTNGGQLPGSMEARLGEVTAHRLTDEESRIVQELLSLARKPFDVAAITGDDPATRFLPVVPERDDSTS